MEVPYRLPMLLDGAAATEFHKLGYEYGESQELWCLSHKEEVTELYRRYIRSGAGAVYAPTFSASPLHLAKYGIDTEEKYKETIKALVALAADAVKAENAHVIVVGDMSPVRFENADEELTFWKMLDIYTDWAEALAEAGCDVLAAETMSSMEECRAALLGGKKTGLPVWITVTADDEGLTVPNFSDTSVMSCLITLQAMGADAFGLNCTPVSDITAEMLEELREYADIPLIVKPSAVREYGGKDGVGAEEFAEFCETLADMGADLIGGCCGTDPDYIKAAADAVFSKHIHFERTRTDDDELILANNRQLFFLSPDCIESCPPLTCNLDMSDELLELEDTNYDVIAVEIISAEDAFSFAENEHMSNLPVMFRSDNEMALRAALLAYQGRAMIDSNCAVEREKLEQIAEKYGAVIY